MRKMEREAVYKAAACMKYKIDVYYFEFWLPYRASCTSQRAKLSVDLVAANVSARIVRQESDCSRTSLYIYGVLRYFKTLCHLTIAIRLSFPKEVAPYSLALHPCRCRRPFPNLAKLRESQHYEREHFLSPCTFLT
jgi:hypothetical protein